MRVINIQPIEVNGRMASILYAEFTYDFRQRTYERGYYEYEFYDADRNVIPDSYGRFDVTGLEGSSYENHREILDKLLWEHVGSTPDYDHFEKPVGYDGNLVFSFITLVDVEGGFNKQEIPQSTNALQKDE